MIVIVCVDSGGGTMFNRRRQSQDRVLREHILNLAGARPVWMNADSARQFEPAHQGRLEVREDFLTAAGEGDFCFVEGSPLRPYESKLEMLILFRWDRTYPADERLDLPLVEHGWKLQKSSEFTGYSHEKITEEVYAK